MAASSKRASRVKKRKEYEHHTGVCKKAKRNTFDTAGETDVIAQELGNRKKFHPHDLVDFKALNPRQEDFLNAYFQDVPMILVTGVPGSAKSWLSLRCALNDVVDPTTPYERVIIVRSAVATREIGHLKGSEQEKAEVYERPYEALASEIMPNFKNAYSHLKALGYVEFCLTSHLRGLTWDNAIVIFDEFQSSTFHEINTVITRIGEDSRIILAGDINQNDLTKKNDQTGFHRVLESMEKMKSKYTSHIHYGPEDCVRSGLVRDWILATY